MSLLQGGVLSANISLFFKEFFPAGGYSTGIKFFNTVTCNEEPGYKSGS